MNEPDPRRPLELEVYAWGRGRNRRLNWRLKAPNGEVIAGHAQGYARRADLDAALQRIADGFGRALCDWIENGRPVVHGSEVRT